MKYKYAWCKLKNIALVGKITDEDTQNIYPHIDLLNHLPSDCIRIKSISNWCREFCKECYCASLQRKEKQEAMA